ncbi:beta-1,3-galactosyltransferase 2-like [Scleropages formosus]|uniref:Hexosyltransferase n=1 Tax=Scleropages formosus TaxID=113540 RepID=A0A8C9V8N5_SCLFO|nr:beta-1,3-galactosyltransferase 2-like [Scleropages formosus]
MDSQGVVRSKNKSNKCQRTACFKWSQACLLVTFLVLCGATLVLNYLTVGSWSLIVKVRTLQWRQVIMPPTTFKTTIHRAPWKPLRPFDVLYPYKYHFILDEPEKCRSQSPFLVLVVPVAPRNRAVRDTIRRTWGNESLVPGVTIRRLFLLGLEDQKRGLQKELHAESKEHHDLLQANFLDSYLNLTIKTMVMMEWLVTRCPNASYAAKVDTDMFLNVDFLVNTLLDPHTVQPKQNYITGAVMRKARVRRKKSSKFYVPRSVYRRDTYPSYVLGNVYIFSMDLPVKILKASRHVRAFHLEDVYLGMCLKHLGIPPTFPPRSNLFYYRRIPYNRCRFVRLISTTKLNADEIDRYWRDFQKPHTHC